jgi:hypothetical protein
VGQGGYDGLGIQLELGRAVRISVGEPRGKQQTNNNKFTYQIRAEVTFNRLLHANDIENRQKVPVSTDESRS